MCFYCEIEFGFDADVDVDLTEMLLCLETEVFFKKADAYKKTLTILIICLVFITFFLLFHFSKSNAQLFHFNK